MGQGTGLGLAVVHGIVRNRGGIITVDSAPERGTTMLIDLPAAAVPEDNDKDIANGKNSGG